MENTIEFLNIVLHEGVEGVPAEALCEFTGVNGIVGMLKIVKDTLQSEGNGLGGLIILSGNLKDRLAKGSGKVERLQ